MEEDDAAPAKGIPVGNIKLTGIICDCYDSHIVITSEERRFSNIFTSYGPMNQQFALQETKVAAGYPAITACMGAGP